MWLKTSQKTRHHKEILHCTGFSLTYLLFPSFSREAISYTISMYIGGKREIKMGWLNDIKRKRQKHCTWDPFLRRCRERRKERNGSKKRNGQKNGHLHRFVSAEITLFLSARRWSLLLHLLRLLLYTFQFSHLLLLFERLSL